MVTWGSFRGYRVLHRGLQLCRDPFLLGLAEAGLFPGFVLYFTYWFPGHHRAGSIRRLYAGPADRGRAGRAGFDLAARPRGLWGLKGWQCMYLFEAVPTVLIGVAVLFFLTDRPEKARWLAPAERELAGREHRRGAAQVRARAQGRHGARVLDPKVLLLALNYIGIVTASLGMLLFLPQIVKQLGVSNMDVGWLTMIPYGCGAVSMVFFGWLSDRIGDRRWSLFWTCVISAIGLIMAGLDVGTLWALVGMTIAAIGFYGTKGPFWSIPSMWLTGTAAAAGFAWINSVGNLGGFFGPSMVGWAKNLTGSFAGGLYALAVCSLTRLLSRCSGYACRDSARPAPRRPQRPNKAALLRQSPPPSRQAG